MSKSDLRPKVVILAGPNGAGKSTLARELLPNDLGITRFINADLIAAGLSPFAPERAAVQSGRLMLEQIETAVREGESFCIETTLSGTTYLRRIAQWQECGFDVHLIFLTLPDVAMAISRVAIRVKQGGHDIPELVIRRRFERGLANFDRYRLVVDEWSLFDATASPPEILRPALTRATIQARRIATFHDTSLVIVEDGQVVHELPDGRRERRPIERSAEWPFDGVSS